jgi:type I restriction enzyme, S subunit
MNPEGWSITELLNLSSNGLMNGAFNDPKLVGTGYKLINVVNLYSHPCIKTQELDLLNLPSSDYSKFKAEKGDIFFTRSSLKLEGIAHCNIFLDERDDVIFECHIIRIRPNRKKVDSRYLHFYCVSHNARKHFMSYAKTTTMTTIDQNGIGSLTVLLPPLAEQRKIAEILSSWDKAIALLEKLITSKRKLKQGLMQQLLTGKKRFKEFEGSEWKSYSFSEIARLRSKKFDPKTNSESKVCIELEHISQVSGQLLGSIDSSEQSSNKNSFCIGDVLFGKLRPYLKKYWLAQFDGVCSTEIWVLVSQKPIIFFI